MTFSIVARCPRTGSLGVAVSTAIPGVGAICPFARAGVGALCTQSYTNYLYGPDGLALLAAGVAPEEAVARLTGPDPGRALRQLIVVDARGRVAAHTGADCVPARKHVLGDGYAAAGNMLVSEAVVDAVAAGFRDGEAEALDERLLRALEAGQAAGGDKRGRQSAALLVVERDECPTCDLRVDEHPDPVAELRRVHGVAARQLLPFVRSMPTRSDPAGREDPALGAYLLRRVEER